MAAAAAATVLMTGVKASVFPVARIGARRALQSSSLRICSWPHASKQQASTSGLRHRAARWSRRVAASAGPESPSSPSTQQETTPAQSPSSTQQQQPIRVVRVEREEKAWEGVAGVDKGEERDVLGRQAVLAIGDVGFLLLFAAIGRSSHGEGLAPWDVLQTAGPFIAGWLLASPVTGAYGKSARGSDVWQAVLIAGKTWGLGIPAGLLIRSATKGYLPAQPFVLVTLATTFVTLVGWRAALAASAPKPKGGNRKGNPFEFIQLLTSLVKRW
eukprot:jgi/Chlat1/7281/Chrsp58S06917